MLLSCLPGWSFRVYNFVNGIKWQRRRTSRICGSSNMSHDDKFLLFGDSLKLPQLPWQLIILQLSHVHILMQMLTAISDDYLLREPLCFNLLYRRLCDASEESYTSIIRIKWRRNININWNILLRQQHAHSAFQRDGPQRRKMNLTRDRQTPHRRRSWEIMI